MQPLQQREVASTVERVVNVLQISQTLSVGMFTKHDDRDIRRALVTTIGTQLSTSASSDQRLPQARVDGPCQRKRAIVVFPALPAERPASALPADLICRIAGHEHA